MSDRMKPIIGAALAGLAINYIGVTYLFAPALETSQGTVLVPAPYSLIIGIAIMVLFFDTFVQKVGNSLLTAMIIAISQILLVDFYYVMNGTRAVQPALFSAAIIISSWWVIAKTYDALS